MHSEDTASEDRARETELAPIHQRTSRRIRGASPEYGLLPATSRAAAATSKAAAATSRAAAAHPTAPTMASDNLTPCQCVFQQPRKAPSFHGDAFEDAEDWLELYERVARFNGWDQARKLRDVHFTLEDGARTWSENHEADFTSWDEFRRRFLKTFARGDRKEKAEAALRSKNQGPNESVSMYYEEMSRLFRRADPSMAEDKKLRHLMRGVKQELFAGLVRNPPRTVTEFLTEATTMERTLEQRARQYDRHPACASVDVFASASGTSRDTLRELIRSVIREELHLLQLPQASPTYASLTQLVKEEVKQAVQPPVNLDMPPPSRISESATTYSTVLQEAPTYAASNVAVATTGAYAPSSAGVFIRRQPGNCSAPPAGRSAVRKTDVWPSRHGSPGPISYLHEGEQVDRGGDRLPHAVRGDSVCPKGNCG
ncbi:uncharacterized protein LOC144166190 [Haemaphysalis longicornis]